MENRKEPYGIKSVYWNRYCSGVNWTVTFHVYRFDFIIGGMKEGMLEMANGHFFRGIRKINSRCKIIDNIRQQIEFNSKSLSDKDIQLMTLSLNSS